MRVISKKRLREFWEKHPDSQSPLEEWYKLTRKANWRNLAEVRATFRHADPVGTCTVFNIKGNNYRLITKIDYAYQKVFIKYVLTHPEYDRGKWKDVCGC
ncbi:MAG: type II toxin-antitoxin system HigB family toxin [Blastocatellia bacterium]